MRTLLFKIFLILLMSYSLFMMLILLNYLEVGYNFLEYAYFIKWYILILIISCLVFFRI